MRLLERAHADRRAIEQLLDGHFVVLQVLGEETGTRERREGALRRQDLRVGSAAGILRRPAQRRVARRRRECACDLSDAEASR